MHKKLANAKAKRLNGKVRPPVRGGELEHMVGGSGKKKFASVGDAPTLVNLRIATDKGPGEVL